MMKKNSAVVKQRKEPFVDRRRAKLKNDLKTYLDDVVKPLPEIQEEKTLRTVLNQLDELAPLYVKFHRLSKAVVKVLAKLWSRKLLTVRQQAFACIVHYLSQESPRKDDLFEAAIKSCYLGFVQNTKLINNETWPVIEYMQDSFAKLCALNPDMTYRYGFVYIRQMAIHLRNAMISKKKELVQTVYNWQFIQCLSVWAKVLCLPDQESSVLGQLKHPLVQVCIGCIRLIPTLKYYPLRYHCVLALLQLANSRPDFIPVLSLVTEMLENTDLLNKKHSRQSLKTFNFRNLLKGSKSQLQEKGFKDALMEASEELLLKALSLASNSLAFPELVFPTLTRLKMFCRNSKIGAYGRQMRNLAEKIQEHADFVDQKRKRWAIHLGDADSVREFEEELGKDENSPLVKYFASWKKLRERTLKLRTAEEAVEEEDPQPDADKGPKENNVGEDVVSKKKRKKEAAEKGPTEKKKRKQLGLEEAPAKGKESLEEDFEDDVVADLDFSDLDD